MTIKTLTEVPSTRLDFVRREWGFADLEQYGRIIDWKPTKLFIQAFDHDELIGDLELLIQGGVMHIEDLIIHHDWQRKGVGRTLMLEAEKIAREQKLHKIYLETGENWPARKFYDSLGYIKNGELPNHLIGVTYVIYTKFL